VVPGVYVPSRRTRPEPWVIKGSAWANVFHGFASLVPSFASEPFGEMKYGLTQWPATHAPPEQACPHSLQLAGSDNGSMQAPPQTTSSPPQESPPSRASASDAPGVPRCPTTRESIPATI